MQHAISIYYLVNNIFSKKENQISQFGLIYFSSTILKMDLFWGGKRANFHTDVAIER